MNCLLSDFSPYIEMSILFNILIWWVTLIDVVKLSLHFWNKPNLTMIYLFIQSWIIFINSLIKICALCIYLHKWISLYFSYLFWLSIFGIKVKLALKNLLGNVPSYLSKKFSRRFYIKLELSVLWRFGRTH